MLLRENPKVRGSRGTAPSRGHQNWPVAARVAQRVGYSAPRWAQRARVTSRVLERGCLVENRRVLARSVLGGGLGGR